MARWTIFGTELTSGIVRFVLAIIVGSAVAIYGAHMYTSQSTGLQSADPVEATVVSTSIEETGGQGVGFSPQATFNFTYQGESYTSTNLYPGGISREFGSESEARSVLDGYEQGDRVTAYVPPGSPGEAYLERSSSNKPFLVIGVGLVILAGGLFKGWYRSYKLGT